CLDEAHRRQRMRVDQRLHARGTELGAADTAYPDAGESGAERVHQVRTVHVARGFAGDEEDVAAARQARTGGAHDGRAPPSAVDRSIAAAMRSASSSARSPSRPPTSGVARRAAASTKAAISSRSGSPWPAS